MNRRSLLVVAMTGLFAACMSLVSTSAAFAKGGVKEPRVEGTLASVNVVSSQVTITLQGGATRTLTIPATAKIERNGVPATLASFKKGDRVQARFTADGSTVVKFEGTGA